MGAAFGIASDAGVALPGSKTVKAGGSSILSPRLIERAMLSRMCLL
jgi:hypothetical protein